ncbi:MAG: hypothetical protein WCK76_02135 [Elusimicrobiota bacterium]
MNKALIFCCSLLFLSSGPAACLAAEEGAAAAGYGAAGELPAPPSVWAGTDAQKEYLVRFFAIKAEDGDAEWRASELNNAIELLARLPVPFRSCTRGLRRVKAGRKEGVKGYVEMNEAPVVFLTSEGADYRGISGWLVHEMTHCFQMAHPEVLAAWENKFWSSFVFFSDPKTPSATVYGNSSSKDDMAESVRKYLQLGKGMASSFPDRYEFIRVNIMAGVEFEPQPA